MDLLIEEGLKNTAVCSRMILISGYLSSMNLISSGRSLKIYVNSIGVEIIGDIPIYMGYDSADVWAESQYFQLNEDRLCEKVAGVPPDAFSDLGQKWGNPLYDWDTLEKMIFVVVSPDAQIRTALRCHPH